MSSVFFVADTRLFTCHLSPFTSFWPLWSLVFLVVLLYDLSDHSDRVTSAKSLQIEYLPASSFWPLGRWSLWVVLLYDFSDHSDRVTSAKSLQIEYLPASSFWPLWSFWGLDGRRIKQKKRSAEAERIINKGWLKRILATPYLIGFDYYANA